MKRAAALSLVEDGWWSARVLSIGVARELPLEVRHYVRGALDASVLRMITPYDGVRLTPVPRLWFKVARFVLVSWGLWLRRWRLIVVDNERTRRLVERLARSRAPVVEAHERYGQLSYSWDEQELSADQVIERLQKGSDGARSALL